MNVIQKNPEELAGSLSKWKVIFFECRKSRTWRYSAAFLVFIGGVGIGLTIQSFLDRPSIPSIRTEFDEAYAMHKEELRAPINSAQPVALPNKHGRGFIQAAFENAWLFFLDNPGKLYAVPLHDSKKHFVDKDDDQSIYTSWTYSNEEIRKRDTFKDVRESCMLPQGAFAIDWDKNPEEWKWIGCGQWYCGLDGRNIYFQDFDGGRMIGPVRTARQDDSSQIIILLKSGEHFAVRSKEAAPAVSECAF
jgi:hypothetical protein